jgi:ribosomal-protein-alanine N-acetyltransferase
VAQHQAIAAGVTIGPARADDLDAIKALADAGRAALGFVRRPALAEAIARGELLAAERAGEVVGFVEFHRRRDGQVTLYHIAVAPAARRQGVGRAMLDGLVTVARASSAGRILLKCPIDLPANTFYQRYGFQLQETLNGRKRALNVWILPVE